MRRPAEPRHGERPGGALLALVELEERGDPVSRRRPEVDPQAWADQENVRLHVHVSGLQQRPGRLAAVPAVRGREVPVDGEVAGQASPKVVEWLNAAEEGPKYTLVKVPEIRIGHHESRGDGRR
jgi:hypothetical protein